jgi:hypothetical protein
LSTPPSKIGNDAVNDPCGANRVTVPRVPASMVDVSESCQEPKGVVDPPLQSEGPSAEYVTDGGSGVHGKQPNPEQPVPHPGGQFGGAPASQVTHDGIGK